MRWEFPIEELGASYGIFWQLYMVQIFIDKDQNPDCGSAIRQASTILGLHCPHRYDYGEGSKIVR